jgi:hypothetical protein
MDYFISHIGIIFIAACFVAACAVAWWYLTDKNAQLKRQRAEARKAAALKKKEEERAEFLMLSLSKVTKQIRYDLAPREELTE